jgi:tetratricopeptide (TPR) repeat protein
MTDWNRVREIQNLRESGLPAEALTEFKALRDGVTDAGDTSSILLHESLCHRDLGCFDNAAEAAAEAVRLLPEGNPTRPYAEFSLACVHESAGKLDLAVKEFRTLLKRHADLLGTSGYLAFRRGVQLRLMASLIVLGNALELLSIAEGLEAESISLEERAELAYREAQAHGLLRRHDRALKLYQEAANGPLERSLAARAHFHVGEILYDRGELTAALEEFKIAEKVVEVGKPDKELFTKWVEHTTRALNSSRSSGPRPH